MKSVTIDQLDTVIQSLLDEYGDSVYYALGEAADEIASETAKVVKKSAPKLTGEYKKKIAAKKEKNKSLGSVHNYVYVKDPEYRKAHLLEFGHASSGGTSRVAAQPHFSDGEAYVQEEFEEKLKKKVGEMNG